MTIVLLMWDDVVHYDHVNGLFMLNTFPLALFDPRPIRATYCINIVHLVKTYLVFYIFLILILIILIKLLDLI